MTVLTRTLGRSGIIVSALGLGCWAIGGPFVLNGMCDGWGDIDDDQSVAAIHRAMALGINFLDTADCYGVGHSEEVIGRAIAGSRSNVIIATKFGFFGNEATKTLHGTNITPRTSNGLATPLSSVLVPIISICTSSTSGISPFRRWSRLVKCWTD